MNGQGIKKKRGFQIPVLDGHGKFQKAEKGSRRKGSQEKGGRQARVTKRPGPTSANRAMGGKQGGTF